MFNSIWSSKPFSSPTTIAEYKRLLVLSLGDNDGKFYTLLRVTILSGKYVKFIDPLLTIRSRKNLCHLSISAFVQSLNSFPSEALFIPLCAQTFYVS